MQGHIPVPSAPQTTSAQRDRISSVISSVSKPIPPTAPVLAAATAGQFILRILYVFSGIRRKSDVRECLQELCDKASWLLDLVELDTELDSAHDITVPAVWDPIFAKIKEGHFSVVVMTPPCGTWSRVRFANNLGPRPCRDKSWPWGYPWLEGQAFEQVQLGNALVLQTLEGCAAASLAGCSFVIEHPEDLGMTFTGDSPASIWQLPAVRQLAADSSATTFALYQCEYLAETSKPTRFLTNLPAAKVLPAQGWGRFSDSGYYTGPLPVCCPHGKHAKKLVGKSNGKWVTSAAAAYPPLLCKFLAQLIVDSVAPTLLKMGSPAATASIVTLHPPPSFPFPPSPPIDHEEVPVDQVEGQEGDPEGEPTSSEEEDGFRRPLLKDHQGGSGEPIYTDVGGRSKPFQDGCGLCSPGRWHPSKRNPPSAFGVKLRGIIDEFIEQEIADPPRMVMAMALGQVTSSPFKECAMADLRERWFKLLPDPLGAKAIREFQPFYLSAIAQSLRECGDPDSRVFDCAAQNYTRGAPVGGADSRLPRTPAVFPRKVRWRHYHDGELIPEMLNYATAVETGDFLEREFQAESDLGMMYQCSLREARLKFGSRLRISAQGAVEKGGGDELTWRIVHDATHGTKVNHEVKPRDQLVVPGAGEAITAMTMAAVEHPGVHMSLLLDIKKAHRRFVHLPEDHGLLACRSNSSIAEGSDSQVQSDEQLIWVNRCGTFGVSSAAHWWGRLAAGIGRLVYQLWGSQFAFQFLYADDVRLTTFGEEKYLAILRGLILWLLVGSPLSWGKVRGGLSMEWLGFFLDYSSYRVGISIARSQWLINWGEQILANNVVLARHLACGLGRVGFASHVLHWLKPFMAPLYSWVAAVPGGSLLTLPRMCRITMVWIVEQLKAGRHMVDCSRPRVEAGELFRTDAKGAPDKVVLGGWRSQGGASTKDADWFSLEITEAECPWLFKQTSRGVSSSPTISAGELLATMMALEVFPLARGLFKGKVRLTGLTDNQGNCWITKKYLTTKMPVAALLMQMSLHLATKDVELALDWIPREANVEADALTNGDFSLFTMAKRIDVSLANLDLSLMLQLIATWDELDVDCKKRKAEAAAAATPGSRHRRKRKKLPRDPWG